HFNSVCPGPGGHTAYVRVRTYDHHQETFIDDENGFASWCPSAIQTSPGHLNRVEIHLSQSHIEIWASDASPDGVNFGGLKELFSAPVNLGFSRGYLYFGVHNHATEKYAGLPSWNVEWDNITFDGPRFVPDRVYQVDSAAVASG